MSDRMATRCKTIKICSKVIFIHLCFHRDLMKDVLITYYPQLFLNILSTLKRTLFKIGAKGFFNSLKQIVLSSCLEEILIFEEFFDLR